MQARALAGLVRSWHSSEERGGEVVDVFVLVGHEGKECERLYGTPGMLDRVQDVVFYGVRAK